MSKHRFPYKWHLKDGYPAKGIKPNGCKVFGTFVCGGGSTMGYKLAGYDHLGGVEIDPKIAEVYRLNHDPKFFYEQDIRIFNLRDDLPVELYDLDLLDGSPPCSSFSMAGNRDKDWGKKKVFREGQAKQRLDDLVFEYVKTIKKLQPKVALLENVAGMLRGNAKAYTKRVFQQFTKAGYRVQLFLLNAASMGVPQKRERVFFIGLRKDFDLPLLELVFDEEKICFGSIEDKEDNTEITGTDQRLLWDNQVNADKSLNDICKRIWNKNNFFSHSLIFRNKVMPTITGHTDKQHWLKHKPRHPNTDEIINASSFPGDFNFLDTRPGYLIGMSVPPVMTAQIAHQIWLQWLSKIK